MMKIKFYLAFLMLAILAIMLMGAAATLSLKTSGLGFKPGVKRLVSYEINEDLCCDPVYDADNGFVVNPYQGGNLDQNQALIIGASVSYILKEVKSFTIFAVALAGLALFAYVTIAFIFLSRIVRPDVKAEEKAQKKEELEMRNEEYVSLNNNKEPIDCIGDRNLSAAFLSRNIDEMLADIDKAME
jgi:hypothetical protein